eukprot:GFUD01016241.1.p1 GENE.GFUD01016241.1~~GFUD01016241.1.p1  ORF type:complete len:991 (+),score=217.81 GFUD01016241.1:98-3070(+)
MSKFTLEKLKELKDRVENVVASPPEIDPEDQSHDLQKEARALSQVEKDISPMKEKILLTFANLAPNTDGGGMTKSESTDSQESGSWLTNVKGKLAKTVDTSLEKYHEIKTERERLRMTKGSEISSSLDLEEEDLNSSSSRRLSHSYSEMALHDTTTKATKETQRPHSQVFDFDGKEFDLETQLKSAAQDIPYSEQNAECQDQFGTSTPLTDTPSKARKRFGMPSFLNRNSTPTTPTVSGSPSKTDEPKIETPKRTFRSLIGSYVGKSSQNTPEHSSSPPKDLPLQDPFSGIENERLEVTVETVQRDPVQESREATPLSEVEEGLEAAELSMTPELIDIEEPAAPEPIVASPPRAQPPPPLHELFSPILIVILAVVNMLLPLWISGFLTGLIISMILTYWVLSYINPPVTYDQTPPVPIASPIEIHEPPALVEAWMNLLPHQFHPYEVDTYEVRNTVSVRITVEHHMLKIEYPEWNLPKRLNTDEVIPGDLKFLYHSDHIDLTKAKISLLPEGIAGKRMFSKKYPIEIRQNALSTISSNQNSNVIRQNKSSPVSEDLGSEDEDFFQDVNETEDEQTAVADSTDCKVFYLFARADREKEDLYKSFMDAHFFLTDTVLDVARREDAITVGIDRDAGGRETVRERKTRFCDFMGRVIENQRRDTNDQSDACLNFLNVYLNRVFYDIHKSEEIKTLLKTRVYNKLLKIKITQWFKSIELTEINMGSNLPRVSWVSNLHQNERGLWVELGLEYDGVASATIETCGLTIGDEMPDAGSGAVHLKDLLNETETALPIRPATPEGDVNGRKISSRIEAATNSDEEDSAEEDSDSQELPVEQHVGLAGSVPDGGVPRARWWEVVGNSELVKSGINKLSNSEWWKQKTSKKMTLQLEIASLRGVVVLNIPPPPSDRLWYGFKSRPDLGLRIIPFYGENKLGNDNTLFSRAINKSIDVVVNRLKEEIHKFILLPNMDDIPIRIMDPFPTTNEKTEGVEENVF